MCVCQFGRNVKLNNVKQKSFLSLSFSILLYAMLFRNKKNCLMVQKGWSGLMKVNPTKCANDLTNYSWQIIVFGIYLGDIFLFGWKEGSLCDSISLTHSVCLSLSL